MVSYFNSLTLFKRRDINILFLKVLAEPLILLSLSLKALKYSLILGNIETNGLITSSEYPVKYWGHFYV